MALILVVDDDHTVREVVVSYLRAGGHTVTDVEDGEQALKAMREEPADLVVIGELWPKSSPTRSLPLSSVPFFGNYNGNVGTEREGSQWFVNIQPVVPFTLNPDWYVISRTILPVMFSQNGLFPGSGSQSGLRDTTEALYFSPKRTFNGFTLGVGPIFLLPTATDELPGAGKWGAGPTGVVVWQGGGWTVGILAGHNWSFAGDADRADVDETFLQPVLAYTTSRAWTFTLQGENTYNWETGEWLAPVNFLVSKVVKVGGQPVSIVGGVRYWMDFPDTGPHGSAAGSG